MTIDPQALVTITYVNYKGETHVYRIEPTGKLVRGPNKWHPDASWLIEATVIEKDGGPINDFVQQIRTFDPAKIQLWTATVEPDPVRRAAYLLLYHAIKHAKDPSAIVEHLGVLHRALRATEPGATNEP